MIKQCDYNPWELALYLRKKNTDANIRLEIVNGEYVIYTNRTIKELKIPRGWKHYGTQFLRNKKNKTDTNYYKIRFILF